jgi:hypothetical protein
MNTKPISSMDDAMESAAQWKFCLSMGMVSLDTPVLPLRLSWDENHKKSGFNVADNQHILFESVKSLETSALMLKSRFLKHVVLDLDDCTKINFFIARLIEHGIGYIEVATVSGGRHFWCKPEGKLQLKSSNFKRLHLDLRIPEPDLEYGYGLGIVLPGSIVSASNGYEQGQYSLAEVREGRNISEDDIIQILNAYADSLHQNPPFKNRMSNPRKTITDGNGMPHRFANEVAAWVLRVFKIEVAEPAKWSSVPCPLHDDQKNSASINLKMEIFRCHACDISMTFQELSKKLNIAYTGEGNQIVYSASDLPRVSEETWQILANVDGSERIYKRANGLCRINTEGILEIIDFQKLLHNIRRTVRYVRPIQGEDGDQQFKAIAPPPALISDLLASPHFPVPEIKRVVFAPVTDANGIILFEEGLHEGGIFLSNAHSMLPKAIDRISIAKAKENIDELYIDFPFASNADKTNIIAFLFTPIVREMIKEPVPHFLISAPNHGTGKTILTKNTAELATGNNITENSWPERDDEIRKKLTSNLLTESEVIIFDNVNNLDSPDFAALLTSYDWSDRILGKNEMIRIPFRKIICSTGKNPSLSLEIARRTIMIRLEARVENPSERNDFKHANLEQWIDEHRELLMHSILSIVEGWVDAGKPKPSNKINMGAYWTFPEVMGGILEFAGWTDFLANRNRIYEISADENDKWRSLCHIWWRKHQNKAIPAREIAELMFQIDEFQSENSNNSTISPKEASKLVKKMEGRVFADFMIRLSQKKTGGSKHYQLQKIS